MNDDQDLDNTMMDEEDGIVSFSVGLDISEEMFEVIKEKCRLYNYTMEDYIKHLMVRDNGDALLSLSFETEDEEDFDFSSDSPVHKWTRAWQRMLKVKRKARFAASI